MYIIRIVARQILFNTYPLIFKCELCTFKEYRSKFPISISFLFYLFLQCHTQSSKLINTSLISPSFISAKFSGFSL